MAPPLWAVCTNAELPTQISSLYIFFIPLDKIFCLSPALFLPGSCFSVCFANKECALFQLLLGLPGWLSRLCDTLQLSCKPWSEKTSFCGQLLWVQNYLSSSGARHALAGG